MFDSLDLILPDEVHDGPMQMALDEVLLGAVVRPTLRIYRWSSPCVTFGYFQSFTAVREAYPALALVRRWTGGGMVEHGKDLTFSLMLPKETKAASMPPALFYRELHHRLASWLAGVVSSEVRLAGREDIQAGPACFSAPAGDDLLLSGQKILGGAQRRSAGALLYQGSLQRLERLPLDYVPMARSLSPRVDQQVIGGALMQEANLLADRCYRSNEWVMRR
jgi:lipoate-protein ligase A